ncbi:MAG: helix-turn-helix domain-containing protein [Bdellovibrionales bacterium]|nr:helix-turn-helix domain-containing protein [Bdellovibrionales bacterium]MCB0408538.1 helix-turn-helix domain-containing protein [Bdellovibrionales bacterium]
MNNKDSGGVFVEKKKDSRLFDNRIWNIKDVSSYTGYAVGTLYNLASKNLIPYIKKRGKLYFIPCQIQNWIEEGDL